MKNKNDENKSINKSEFSRFVLTGDIGATKSILAIIGINKNTCSPPIIILSETIDTNKIDNISTPINNILKKAHEHQEIEVTNACLGLAGPLDTHRRKCKLTNSKLKISVDEILTKTLLGSITLLNDFETISLGVIYLDKNKKDVINLTKNKHPRPETIAVLGPGTGLGKSFLTNSEKNNYRSHKSEGGHASFPPANEFELELSTFIKTKLKLKHSVDYEDVCSGRGISNIFEFLIKKRYFPRSSISRKIFKAKESLKPRLISENSLTDKACRKSISLFVKFTARCASDFALDIMAKEIFIAGGIAPKNKELFEKHFIKEFIKHNTHSDILRKIPIYLILNKNTALLGAAKALLDSPKLVYKK